MSRIGSNPLKLPAGVSYQKDGNRVTVKGPKGEVVLHWPRGVDLADEDGTLTVNRSDNSKQSRASHGTARRILENAVNGVVTPYKRVLEVVGVGYQTRKTATQVGLKVGFANEVMLDIPAGVQVELPSATRIEVTGCDKQVVGAFASAIRLVRPPEPYNGKGIRFDGERIQRKAGKSFASGG